MKLIDVPQVLATYVEEVELQFPDADLPNRFLFICAVRIVGSAAHGKFCEILVAISFSYGRPAHGVLCVNWVAWAGLRGLCCVG